MTRPDETDDRTTPLATEDLRLIETLRSQLDPGERSPSRRAAFVRRLEERLERRSPLPWRPLALATGTAVLAAMLWLGLPAGLPDAVDSAAAGSSQSTPRLLAYAYYETSCLGESEGENSFLSEEYEAIAAAFDVQ